MRIAGRRARRESAPPPTPVGVREETIRLGQFLKLANLVEDGAQAKLLIASGEVLVNDEIELRRGRQLREGDVVSLAGQRAVVAPADQEPDVPW